MGGATLEDSILRLVLACIWLIVAICLTVRVCISFNGLVLTGTILNYIAFALHLLAFIIDMRER